MIIGEEKKIEKRYIIKREIFYFFSAAFLAFSFLEVVSPNIILAYLNLNYLFIACLISGVVSLIKK